MKINFIVCVFLLANTIAINPSLAQTQDFSWITQSSNTTENSKERSHSIARDQIGNLYITGKFYISITIGSTTLTSNGREEIFIAKFDGNGSALWARKAGGSNDDSGNAIAVDKSGNVFITGYFSEIATFGNISLPSSGRNNAFVAKYDNSGNLLWARKGGGSYNEEGNGIVVDETGNAFITGNFSGTSRFANITLTSAGPSGPDDIFIAKYDALGNVLWAQKAGGNSYDYGSGIALDNSGNVLITGYFIGSASFNNSTLVSTGSYNDMFIAKYSSTGNLLWAQHVGGESAVWGRDIAIDNQDNIFITGEFSGKTNFGETVLNGNGYADIFITKLNSAGDIIWARSAGEKDLDVSFGIAVDNSGSAYITGYFQGEVHFGSKILSSASSAHGDIFIVKYSKDGDVLFARSAGGSEGFDAGWGIVLDEANNIYLTGEFKGSATFGSTELSGNGSGVFIAKMSSSMLTGMKDFKLKNNILLYPNPTTDRVQITIPSTELNDIELLLLDNKGQQVLKQRFLPTTTSFKQTLDLEEQASGVYLLQLITNKGVISKKIIKQ